MGITKKPIVMPFGRYKGVAVKQMPNSYLRWLVTVPSLPQVIRDEAQTKLNDSDFDKTDIQITRHALDMFSKRFLDKWTDRKIGLATFVAHYSVDALSKGMLIKDKRDLDSGLVMFYDDVVWVFAWPPEAPDYKSLVTVMLPNKQIRKKVENNRW